MRAVNNTVLIHLSKNHSLILIINYKEYAEADATSRYPEDIHDIETDILWGGE